MSEVLYRCRTCLDVEWVAVDAARNLVKPCPACQPTMYARWAAGEFAPDFKLRRHREEPDPAVAADGLASCRDTLKGRQRAAHKEAS